MIKKEIWDELLLKKKQECFACNKNNDSDHDCCKSDFDDLYLLQIFDKKIIEGKLTLEEYISFVDKIIPDSQLRVEERIKNFFENKYN